MSKEVYGCSAEQLAQIISDEAEIAYSDFVAKNPHIAEAEHPWDSPYCFEIVQHLEPRLVNKGINAKIVRGGGHRHGLDDTHEFLETDERLVICPTWQQMVPKRVKEAIPNLPHVLITPRSVIEQVLTFYQVPHIQQLLFNVPEAPDAPWGHDAALPPSIEEHDAVLRAIRRLTDTMRPPQP